MSESALFGNEGSKQSLLTALEGLLSKSFKTIDRRVANPKETLYLCEQIEESIRRLQDLLILIKQAVHIDDPDMKKAELNVYGLQRRYQLVEKLIGSSVVTATPQGFSAAMPSPPPKAIKVKNCYPSPFLLEQEKLFKKVS